MATTLIGTLRPHAKGVHVQSSTYSVMDVVTGADGSRAYMAVQDVPAGIGLDNSAYWCIYTDMSAVKTAMEAAAVRANESAAAANNAILNLTDYTSEYALRVRGEIAESAGNPVTIAPDEGSLIRPVTVFGPKQEGSGDPSPDNVRPIGGYDALKLNHAGKNLFQLNVNGVYTKEGVTFTPDNASGIVKLSGTASARASLRVGKFTANADYEIILNGAEGGSLSTYELCLCDANGNSVLLRSYGGDSVAYMLTNGTSYTLYLFVYSGAVCDGVVVSPMIRLASNTDATFVPYQIDTYTANPSQTVYNGKVDWTKGEMVDDTDLLDLGDYSWFMQYDGVFRTNSYFEGTYANEMVLCSHYKSYGLNLSDIINNNNSVCMIGGYIWVNDKRFADAESLRAALVGVKMTARKVTPTTIQLTPHQILALKGANTFYGDGDSIEAVWVKPLETSISERVEPLIRRIEALEG